MTVEMDLDLQEQELRDALAAYNTALADITGSLDSSADTEETLQVLYACCAALKGRCTTPVMHARGNNCCRQRLSWRLQW